MAIKVMGAVASGEDPLTNKQDLRSGITLAEFADEYLAYAVKTKKPRSVQQGQRHLDQHIFLL